MAHIDKDCYWTIAGIWILAIAVAIIFILLVRNKAVDIAFISLTVVFMGFVTWFHRVPDREAVGSDTVISSIADGKVVIVEKVFEPEYLRKECIQVSVYMNFFDVHANFWPMTGEISYYKYHDGKYLLAFLPKSSEKNEHSSTAIRNSHGEILFRQIAGTFARRIVCYSDKGMDVKAGDQCGIIKFGSRIDIFLPLDAEIKVKPGDLTLASETVIAILK